MLFDSTMVCFYLNFAFILNFSVGIVHINNNWTFVWHSFQDKNRYCHELGMCTVGRAISRRLSIFENSYDLGSIVYFIIRKIIIESQTIFCACLHISIAQALIKRKLVCSMLTMLTHTKNTEKYVRIIGCAMRI